MSQAILDALKALDVSNDNHWTADGLPRLDTIKMLAGDPTLTREKVAFAAPGYIRSAAIGYELPAQPPAPQPSAQPPAPWAATTTAPATATPAQPDPQAQPVVKDGGEEGDARFSKNETEQPSLADGGTPVENEIKALEAKVAEEGAAENRLLQSMGQLELELKKVRARRDEAATALNRLRPARTQAQDIRDYLNRQCQLLEERAVQKKVIAESGLDLKQLAKQLKSPIDVALGQKKSQGARRPSGL